MLEIEARLRRGEFHLDAALVARRGRATVLVGESGSGKTTLLRLVAGLIAPDSGRIVLDGTVLAEPATGRFVPAEKRPVGYVAQDLTLFPHLTVRDNVAFGLRAARRPAAEVKPRTEAALARFELAPLAARRPHQLSGGQQQRVALARALVLDPAVLLLDEPLSALDVVTRRQVRGELRRTLDQLPCVTLIVTHQPFEALALGDEIVVLESGAVSQAGPRGDLLRHPRSRYIAEFLGVNLFAGEIRERGADGLAALAVEGGVLWAPDPGRTGMARVLVHPHDVVVSLEPPAGSARNVLHGAIEEIVPEPPAGERVRLVLATRPPLAAQVTRGAVESLGLRRGHAVYASFKATAVETLP
jgi:molybdate transport system ATP-binding protein